MTTTWYCSAAAACITEAERTRAVEVTLLPGAEDCRVAVLPGLGAQNLVDRRFQEGIAHRDQVLLLGKIAWVVGEGGIVASMHIMALIGADPGVIWHHIVRQVHRELAKVHDICHACRAGLHVSV